MIQHDEQPQVRVGWLMPPTGPSWFAAWKPVTVPLGVALEGERRGYCFRIKT